MKSNFLVLLSLLSFQFANARFQVFPTRVNLTPTEKTATVSVRLRSNKPETFRISTMFYEMTPDGSVNQRPDLSRGVESAAPYISFSPKRVELKPNVEQVVRIRIKNISKLKKEVRTHLYFRPEDPVVKQDQTQQKLSKSVMDLQARVAVAIPVIITPKFIKKDFKLSNFKMFKKDKEVYFKTDLIKTTEGFLYGDIKVYRLEGSKKIIVGSAKGISSYIPKRSVSYPLISAKNAPIKQGKYKLEFAEYSQSEPEKALVKSIEYKFN